MWIRPIKYFQPIERVIKIGVIKIERHRRKRKSSLKIRGNKKIIRNVERDSVAVTGIYRKLKETYCS